MDESQFYSSRNLEKYPDGKLNLCKKCLTAHIDNWDPETVKPLLEEVYVPWVPDKWFSILNKAVESGKRITSLTVFGNYLREMNLTQWNDYTWADNDKVQEEINKEKATAMRMAGMSEETIKEELQKIDIVDKSEAKFGIEEEKNADNVNLAVVQEPDPLMDELSEEDKIYLRNKWGGTYRADEWIKMEGFYEEMCQSYDIRTPAHKDYLLLICKTSLKLHNLLNQNDIEGFQKMSRVYDSLMKSARFTASQDKNADSDYIDSVGEFCLLCEKKGFIPEYYIDKPKDKVDLTLRDIQNYTFKLIHEETNLMNMMESSLREIEADREREAQTLHDDGTFDEEAFEEQLFSSDAYDTLKDEDFVEFIDLKDELILNDGKLIDDTRVEDI